MCLNSNARTARGAHFGCPLSAWVHSRLARVLQLLDLSGLGTNEPSARKAHHSTPHLLRIVQKARPHRKLLCGPVFGVQQLPVGVVGCACPHALRAAHDEHTAVGQQRGGGVPVY